MTILQCGYGLRGLAKIKCVAQLFALAHNLIRELTLTPHVSPGAKLRLPRAQRPGEA
ncbi:MAG TPA: hypothetical protein PKN13_02585 [Accumulibacter sp.]|nr:hypothetical protein [Accumulibacter sp.]HMW16552.1 hypothetical protein [Accumulibacter sp.]HMX21344.1 hypothetical protein [Accumulibacter sp.]HNC18135.1 hypothetical protein [Accumulibacter sp.]HND78950.1 hypothetical protein [Accumulibacter sp.]